MRLGALDDPATYRAACAEHAAMVFLSGTDLATTNKAFTIRKATAAPTPVAVATSRGSVDVLELVGQTWSCRSVTCWLRPSPGARSWGGRRWPS